MLPHHLISSPFAVVTGVYTLYYKFVQSDEWTIQAAIREEIMPQGGKVREPRAGLFVKTWQPTALYADFAQFRFSNYIGPWARAKSVYFSTSQVQACPVFVPLPRYVIYKLFVQAIGFDGLPSDETPTTDFIIGQAPPAPWPSAISDPPFRPSISLDMTNQKVESNMYRMYGGFGTPNAEQWRDAQRPRLSLGQQYDRSALVCYGNKWHEVNNTYAPAGWIPQPDGPGALAHAWVSIRARRHCDPLSSFVAYSHHCSSDIAHFFSLRLSSLSGAGGMTQDGLTLIFVARPDVMTSTGVLLGKGEPPGHRSLYMNEAVAQAFIIQYHCFHRVSSTCSFAPRLQATPPTARRATVSCSSPQALSDSGPPTCPHPATRLRSCTTALSTRIRRVSNPF